MLLDSQVVVWIIREDGRLGPAARRSIEAATDVYVSAATVWELTIKAMLGRLTLPARLTERLEGEGFVLLDVTSRHAEELRSFPELVRHDPFDRLVVAQAHAERQTLLTADRLLLGLRKDFVVDATR